MTQTIPFKAQSNDARNGDYSPAHKRVLLALDDEHLRDDIHASLAAAGHHVVDLDDGLELLDYLRGSRLCDAEGLPVPDAIVASLGLSPLGGLQALGLLREQGVETPFIGLAEPRDRSAFSAARELGVSFIFEAPYSTTDLCEALASLPGGAFDESTRHHDDRVDACRRGRAFLTSGD